jgi:hypothetical protein
MLGYFRAIFRALLRCGRRAGGDPSVFDCIREGRPVEELAALIRSSPGVLRTRDENESLPLHVAAAQGRSNRSRDVVALLAEEWRGARREEKGQGDLPLQLHVAARHASREVVRLLCEGSPDALRIGGVRGERPLRVAARFNDL